MTKFRVVVEYSKKYMIPIVEQGLNLKMRRILKGELNELKYTQGEQEVFGI